jgi:DNA-binding NarL/FixJ family response regulator
MEITLDELAQLIRLVGAKQSNNQVITASLQTQVRPKNKRNKSLSRHSWTEKQFNVVEAMTRAGYSQKQIANELQLRVGQIDGAQMVLRKQGKLVQNG